MSRKKPSVVIAMGSDSDLRILKDAAHTLKDFKIPFEVRVLSAHRTPQAMLEFAQSAESQGIKVIIAGAGGAAHLPGMIASATLLPVIGVPVELRHLDGIDSLLSIAQMPKGVPVATMAIDNATNAALLAVRILALEDALLYKKLLRHQKTMQTKVKKMDQSLRKRFKAQK